jgi:hypothetical protein
MFNEEEFLRIANRPTIEFTGNEFKTKDSYKKRIIEYINQNELDYNVFDGDIFRFYLKSYDDYIFQVSEHNNQYIIIKSDIECRKFEYYHYKNLQQVLEQLAFYDNNLYKVWWQLLDGVGRPSSINIEFVKENYNDDWVNDFVNNEWHHIDEEQYKCLVYEKEAHIKITSPHDIYMEYSPYDLHKLYMEIHPIDVKKGNESYFVKILINNEEVLKEYLKYRVIRKKGLKLFLEELFNNKNQFIKFQ